MTTTQPTPGAIELQAVTKRYATNEGTTTTALRTVSLTVAPGELVTVVGPSGCGKTTLIRLVAGLEAPTTGTVTIDGHSVVGPGPDRPVVFQQPRLFPWLTAKENIAFGLEEQGLEREAIEQRSQELLEAVGLGEASDALPMELSGGMKQRVGLARALAVQPPVLLMDEPFGSVDAQTRRRLQDDLVDVWEQTGRTILFVTHNIEEAVYLGDRVVVLTPNPGQVRTTYTVDIDRPRTRTDPELTAAKEHIFQMTATHR